MGMVLSFRQENKITKISHKSLNSLKAILFKKLLMKILRTSIPNGKNGRKGNSKIQIGEMRQR